MRELTLNFDGSCWPNPGGTAAYGYIVYENGIKVKTGHGVISHGPDTSNNLAEFHALYQGVRGCASLIKEGETATVNCVGDSILVVKMMKGAFKANKTMIYYPDYVKADTIIKSLESLGIVFTFKWVGRDLNQDADILSKIHENNC